MFSIVNFDFTLQYWMEVRSQSLKISKFITTIHLTQITALHFAVI